jgi:hypothetical protein
MVRIFLFKEQRLDNSELEDASTTSSEYFMDNDTFLNVWCHTFTYAIRGFRTSTAFFGFQSGYTSFEGLLGWSPFPASQPRKSVEIASLGSALSFSSNTERGICVISIGLEESSLIQAARELNVCEGMNIRLQHEPRWSAHDDIALEGELGVLKL